MRLLLGLLLAAIVSAFAQSAQTKLAALAAAEQAAGHFNGTLLAARDGNTNQADLEQFGDKIYNAF